MALKSDENITARELLELQKQGFISSSKLLEELKKSKTKEGDRSIKQALTKVETDPDMVDVGAVPMTNVSNFGPVNTGGGVGKAAQGMARDRNMYDMEPEPIIQGPDEMLAKAAYMNQVNQERQAEQNVADKDQERRAILEKMYKEGDEFLRKDIEQNFGGKSLGRSSTFINADQAREEFLTGSKRADINDEDYIAMGLGGESISYIGQGQGRAPSEEQAANANPLERYKALADTADAEQQKIVEEADPPEVAEMKKVQEDPKARAELFKDLPPAIKAQAKEEFGDYYIDPSTGYAINLKSLRKSQKRREHMDIIKHFPESLRPAMLHKWGYLDGEDVPVDERLQLDKQKLGFEMTKYFAGLNENKRQFNATFGEGKRQFDSTLGNKKYEFGESMSFKKTQQALLDKQFGEGKRQFDEKLAETQRTNVISGIGEFLKNGQFEAATFYAKSNGLELPFSITDALRFQSAKKAKSASGDPMTTALASGYSINMKDYWKSSDSTVEKLMSPREDAGSGDSYFDAGMRLINAVPYKELPEVERGKISEADYNAKNFTAVKNMYMSRKYPGFHKEFMELQMLKDITRKRKQKGEDTPEQTNTSTIPSRADDIDEDDLDTSTMSETQSSVVQPSNQTQRRMTGLSEASTGQGFKTVKDLTTQGYQALQDLIEKGKRGREQMRR